MIWARQQRAFGFVAGLLNFWLAHFDARSLEALATMQTLHKCSNTIAQALLLTPPPMAWSVQDDAMFALPASDAKVALI